MAPLLQKLRVMRSDVLPLDGHVWRQVDAKKRWVDPLVLGMGRVSQWSGALREQLASFQALDFPFGCGLRQKSARWERIPNARFLYFI